MCNNVAQVTTNSTGSPRNCTLWDGLGTTYAYIQTGLVTQAEGGTTLTMSKKGSGLPDIVNPCLEKFLLTKSYYKLCQKYNLELACFHNDFFPADIHDQLHASLLPSFFPTNMLNTTDCASGYCPCPTNTTD